MQEIIRGCIQKDRSSQYLLYKEFYSYCIGICKRYALNDSDTSEILNSGFLKVFNHIEKYDPNKPFKAWMGKIMTNTAIDHYRMKVRFINHDDIDEHEHIGCGAVVYEQLAYNDLLTMIQNLSPAYRTVFNMFAIDGYSHEEIGELLNISIGTSKSNLFKARQKLQVMLSAFDPVAKNLKIETANDKNNGNEKQA